MFRPEDVGPAPAAAPLPNGAPVSLQRYGTALGITVLAILSQYFVPPISPAADAVYGYAPTGYLIVYGIPILAFLTLVGTAPLRRWRAEMRRSGPVAFGWYGALSAIAFIVTFALLIVYLIADPSALKLLNKQNPVVSAAASDPWLWIGLSFAIGVIEETIFRGWIFGYWILRGRGSLWVPAIWTSALFAGLHLYYGTTYLVAAPLIYPQLFFLGLAFALAVRSSRGNLVWVALLHGATDAISFYSIVNQNASVALHYGLIGAGAIVAIILYVRSRPAPAVVSPAPGGFPGAPMWGAPGAPMAPPGVTVIPPPPPPPPPQPPPPS